MKKTKSKLLGQLFFLLNKEIASTKKIKETTEGARQIDRREFVKKSAQGALGLGLALSVPSIVTSCSPKEEDNDWSKSVEDYLEVAILGAGMAGLNCANHLMGSGLSYRIYEASNRVGGRILTHYNDSMGLKIYPEFGGDFVDTDHEDMIALAKEFDLELVDLIEEQEANGWVKDIFYFDNRSISEEEIIKEFKKIADKIATDAESLGEDYDTEDAVRLDNLPLSDYINSLECAQWLKDLFVAAWVAEYGLDCEEMSTINMLDMLDTDTDDGFKVFGTSDERYRIKGGNSMVIDRLADKVNRENIFLEYFVEEIEETNYGTYIIRFNEGREIEAKRVVCTIPFTILRNLKLNLRGMSEEKRKCIDELGYGNNTKLILGYDGQPWRSEKNKAMGYLFTNDMTNGWDASLNKDEESQNGAYVAYFGGQFSQDLCDESFPSPMAPKNHVWRTQLPEKRVDGFVNELDKIFIGSKDKFKQKHVFVNWIEYPYVKASYSCYKVGQWTTIAGLEEEPVNDFFFAGEHCSEMFQGFMNGAAESGRRVAQKVIASFPDSYFK